MSRTKGRPAAIGVTDQPTRIALLSIIERVEKRARNEVGVGAPTGTGTAGDTYYDTVSKRLYASNGTTWTLQLAARIGGTWTRSATQSINNNTSTNISWDAETSDSDNFLTPTTTGPVIPAGLGGLYAIVAEVTYSVVALGVNSLQLTATGFTDPMQFSGNTRDGLQVAAVTIPLAAGASITAQTLHNNGVAQNVLRGRLDVYRVGV